MKNKGFFLGILLGSTSSFLIFLLLQYCFQLVAISSDESIVITAINLLSSVVTGILSAFVAFLVAYFQVKKEKDYNKKDYYKNNLKYLKVLKHESDINLYNVKKAIKNKEVIDPKMMLKNLDNTISMKSWEDLYIKIETNEQTFDTLSKLHRTFRKITGTPENEFELLHLKKLISPLEDVISLINEDISNLEKEIAS